MRHVGEVKATLLPPSQFLLAGAQNGSQGMSIRGTEMKQSHETILVRKIQGIEVDRSPVALGTVSGPVGVAADRKIGLACVSKD